LDKRRPIQGLFALRLTPIAIVAYSPISVALSRSHTQLPTIFETIETSHSANV